MLMECSYPQGRDAGALYSLHPCLPARAGVQRGSAPLGKPVGCAAVMTSITFNGATRCGAPVLPKVLQDVLTVGRIPNGIARHHVVGATCCDHHS